MTFKDLEDWQKELVVKNLKDGENIYIEYTKDDIIASFKQENQKLKKQQKEFIEYLEDKLNMCDGFLDTIKSDLEEIPYAGRISGKSYITTKIMKNETAKKNYEDILSKYKEIIGDDNK